MEYFRITLTNDMSKFNVPTFWNFLKRVAPPDPPSKFCCTGIPTRGAICYATPKKLRGGPGGRRILKPLKYATPPMVFMVFSKTIKRTQLFLWRVQFHLSSNVIRFLTKITKNMGFRKAAWKRPNCNPHRRKRMFSDVLKNEQNTFWGSPNSAKMFFFVFKFETKTENPESGRFYRPAYRL